MHVLQEAHLQPVKPIQGMHADLFFFPGELEVFAEDESKWQLLKIFQTPDTFLPEENDHVSAGIHKTMTLLLCWTCAH